LLHNPTVFTQELQTKFMGGRVTVYNDGIVVKSESGLELLTITLLPEMEITYGESESVLEIRYSGYRCVLWEAKD
jgi:hypothetical protein